MSAGRVSRRGDGEARALAALVALVLGDAVGDAAARDGDERAAAAGGAAAALARGAASVREASITRETGEGTAGAGRADADGDAGSARALATACGTAGAAAALAGGSDAGGGEPSRGGAGRVPSSGASSEAARGVVTCAVGTMTRGSRALAHHTPPSTTTSTSPAAIGAGQRGP